MSSNLPRQVQEASEEADRLEKTLQPANDEGGAPAPNEPNQGAQVPAQPQAAPRPEPSKADDPSWQQRYQTLQGMYNAEVPRMNQQIRDLQSQLNETLARLNAPPKEAAKPQAPPKVAPGSEKDVELFGSDLIEMIRRQSADLVQAERDRVNAEMQKLNSENAELKTQLGSVVVKQGEGSRLAYMQALEKEVPDWQVLNIDSGFLAWLAEVDPLSGIARQAYLGNAWEQFDAGRTAKLFITYKQLAGITPGAPAKATPQQELARQVAPGTTKSTAPDSSGTPNERIWTKSQIETFYTDVTKGKFSNRKDDAARIEAEIDAAVATGRVR